MPSTAKRILFRADGNSSIGLGHIYRCLALSEIVGNELRKIFVIKVPESDIRELLSGYCEEVVAITHEDEFFAMIGSEDIVILDSYSHGMIEHQKIKERAGKFVCLDDMHDKFLNADLVINHSGGIDSTDYELAEHSRLLLGPAYAILRSPFWEKPKTENREPNAVFINLGGADPDNNTAVVLNRIAASGLDVSIHLVLGSAYRHQEKLESLIKTLNQKVTIHRNLSAESMSELMQLCSIGVCSPSSVSYEYLSIGGELYLIQTADNQAYIYDFLLKSGLGFPLAEFRVTDKDKVKQSLTAQEEIFDGKSYRRLRKEILES